MTQKLSYLMWNDWNKDVRSAAAQALGRTGNGKVLVQAFNIYNVHRTVGCDYPVRHYYNNVTLYTKTTHALHSMYVSEHVQNVSGFISGNVKKTLLYTLF